jgi:putative transposase
VERDFLAKTFSRWVRLEGKTWSNLTTLDSALCSNASFCWSIALLITTNLCDESELNLELMRLIDEQYLKTPFYGHRQMARHLRREGYAVSRTRIGRLMKLMGLSAIYQRPNTSKPNIQHKVYPYLLRGMTIDQPNQVWCADITYIPMRKGFLYLAAIMDWASRRVLSWRLSNTMETDFCVAALEEAMARYGKPEIFNTDQGRQFTSDDFTGVLKHWIDFYNIQRPHSSLDDKTPDGAYWQKPRPGYAGPSLKLAA